MHKSRLYMIKICLKWSQGWRCCSQGTLAPRALGRHRKASIDCCCGAPICTQRTRDTKIICVPLGDNATLFFELGVFSRATETSYCPTETVKRYLTRDNLLRGRAIVKKLPPISLNPSLAFNILGILWLILKIYKWLKIELTSLLTNSFSDRHE